MPNYKVVDADQLDADLKSVADSIRAKAGIEGKLEFPNGFKTAIEGITGSGGSAEDVRYVTFMSHDGAVTLGRKAVAVGDDCADPIARGIFTTPTRESDVQFNFTHDYWSAEPNGATDLNALKSVTEDRVVYATYIATVRYYTISYYDGSRLIATQQLAYGATPNYTTTKDGYSFVGWEPQFTKVTGDASYYAQFEEVVTFAGGSWASISAISKAGNAREHFKIGDERILTVSGKNYILRIVGFDHDVDMSNNPIGISCLLFTTHDYSMWTTYGQATGISYRMSEVYNKANIFYKTLPSDLREVVVEAKKYANTPGESPAYGAYTFWNPSSLEVYIGTPTWDISEKVGSLYEYFSNVGASFGDSKNDATKVTDLSGSTQSKIWCRDGRSQDLQVHCMIDGNLSYTGQYTSVSNQSRNFNRYSCIGFCI